MPEEGAVEIRVEGGVEASIVGDTEIELVGANEGNFVGGEVVTTLGVGDFSAEGEGRRG